MQPTYLEAKRTIDDRSLNPHVWRRFTSELEDLATGRDAPLSLFDLGAGTGTMLDRLEEWDVLSLPALVDCGVDYLGCEVAPPAYERLAQRCQARDAAGSRGALRSATASATDVRILLVEGADPSLFPTGMAHDAIIAHAVIDLFTPEETAAIARRLLVPGGLLYASIVFDGETLWAPGLDSLDAAVMQRYHASMARDGRRAFAREQLVTLRSSGFDLLDLGASDWVVAATDGDAVHEYTLVSSILAMIDETVRPRCDAGLAETDLDEWLRTRRRQLETGELVFIAHQFDMLLRVGTER